MNTRSERFSNVPAATTFNEATLLLLSARPQASSVVVPKKLYGVC